MKCITINGADVNENTIDKVAEQLKEQERKILFTVTAVRWFDSHPGNTYHSVRIIRHSDGAELAHELTYGYNRHYEQTALKLMLDNGWLAKRYDKSNYLRYNRENGYCIEYVVSDGTKKDCIDNGKL